MGDLQGRLSLHQLTVFAFKTEETLQISDRIMVSENNQMNNSGELVGTIYHKMLKDLEDSSVY